MLLSHRLAGHQELNVSSHARDLNVGNTRERKYQVKYPKEGDTSKRILKEINVKIMSDTETLLLRRKSLVTQILYLPVEYHLVTTILAYLHHKATGRCGVEYSG